MAETDVESILREIREQIISQPPPVQDVAPSQATSSAANGTNGGNGLQEHTGSVAAESMALLNSYLTTTGRAWDRLPPLISNRNGLSARLELWLKRRLKSATRWFTWEQVNFNAAVHYALRDILQALSGYERELAQLQNKITAETEARGIDYDQLQNKITAETEARGIDYEQLHAEIEVHRGDVHARLDKLISEVALTSTLGEELGELRERDDQVREEQRVCFKQLALETSEAAVLEDRARRQNQALLEELKRRIEQLEKVMSDK